MKYFNDRIEMVAALVKPGSTGAEIGVAQGVFSASLLHCSPAKLYLVDSWKKYDGYSHEAVFNDDNHERNFGIVLGRFNDAIHAKQVEIIRGFSVDAALTMGDRRLDWFYLDANHQYEFALMDLIAWSLYLKPDGFIMGHDYIVRPEENFGVIGAVHEFCARFDWEVEYLTQDGVMSYALRKLP